MRYNRQKHTPLYKNRFATRATAILIILLHLDCCVPPPHPLCCLLPPEVPPLPTASFFVHPVGPSDRHQNDVVVGINLLLCFLDHCPKFLINDRLLVEMYFVACCIGPYLHLYQRSTSFALMSCEMHCSNSAFMVSYTPAPLNMML